MPTLCPDDDRMGKTRNIIEEAIERTGIRRSLPDPDERRAIRVGAGVTQREVALAVGRTPSEVSRWESGDRSPSGDALIAYQRVLLRLQEVGT